MWATKGTRTKWCFMSLDSQISKAIAAHDAWKTRLRSAIDNGITDVDPNQVAKDNACQFGQWLYGSMISPTERASANYATVRRLHALFHGCAGRVLECVATGHKVEADVLMASEYGRISAELTRAMLKWKAAYRYLHDGRAEPTEAGH
jgi:hypothetical protein